MDDVSTPLVGWCLILLFNLTVGALCFAYALWSIFGKDIPWYGDMVAGLFCGQFVVPIALVCWILRLCGMETPFFHG